MMTRAQSNSRIPRSRLTRHAKRDLTYTDKQRARCGVMK